MEQKKKRRYPFITGATPVISRNEWLIILFVNVLSIFILSTDHVKSFLQAVLNVLPGFATHGASKLYEPSLSAMIAPIALVVLFLLMNLLVLRAFVGNAWTQLFRKIRSKDIGIILIFFVLALVVGIFSGNIANLFFGSESNPADVLSVAHAGAWRAFLLGRFEHLFQLMGEELISILPFLALVQAFTSLKWPRKTSLIWALILSSVLFALYHLSTYNYNIGYTLATLTFTRILLTGAYMKTKNIWVSFTVHYLFDFVPFLFSFLLMGK